MNVSVYQIFSFISILIFSLILSVQDIRRLKVGVFIQWLSIFCALACHLIFARTEMWIFVLSSMIMGTFYFAVRKITKDKLGSADVWFGFFQGLFLFPKMIPICLCTEVLASFCIMNKRIGHKQFAFIPFMSFGLILTFILQIAFM